MKKLTAGIFTVLMGLVSVNAADAAVASKGYVDAKVGANTTLIENLSTTVTNNQNTNTEAIAAAKKAGDDAAAALEAYKTSNNTAVSGLDTRVSANETAISDLQSGKADKGTKLSDYGITDAYTKAETDTEIAEAVKGTMEGDVSTALGDYLKKTEAESLYETIAAAQATNDAQDAEITANTNALTVLNGNATVDGSVAKSIADAIAAENLSQYAKTADVTGALADYELKANLKALAYKATVATADIDDGAVTTAKLADGAVDASKLGANAVTDAAVADGALSQDKINGLDTTLATKMTITNATSETGKYVFTANVGEGGVTDYAWELIERGTGEVVE